MRINLCHKRAGKRTSGHFAEDRVRHSHNEAGGESNFRINKKQIKIMKTNGRKSAWVLASAGLSLMCFPMLGQEVTDVETGQAVAETQAEQPAATTPPQPGLPQLTIGAGLSYQADADIHDTDQSFSITRLDLSLGAPITINDAAEIATLFRYELASFAFDNGPDPWHNIHTFSGTGILHYHLDERFSIYGGALLRVSAESGADFSDAFSGGGLAGVNYKFSDTFTAGGGVAIVSQIEDDPLVLPLITIDWRFVPGWRAKVGFLDVATMGYGGAVEFEPNDQWVFGFGVQYHKARFRIERNDEVGQEDAAIIFGQATWRLNPAFDLSGFVGVAAGGNLRLEDSSGDRIVDHDYDAAAVIGVKAKFRL